MGEGNQDPNVLTLKKAFSLSTRENAETKGTLLKNVIVRSSFFFFFKAPGGREMFISGPFSRNLFTDSKGASRTQLSSQSIRWGSQLTVSENSAQFQSTALQQLMGESFLALRLHHLRSGSVTDSCSAQTGNFCSPFQDKRLILSWIFWLFAGTLRLL